MIFIRYGRKLCRVRQVRVISNFAGTEVILFMNHLFAGGELQVSHVSESDPENRLSGEIAPADHGVEVQPRINDSDIAVAE